MNNLVKFGLIPSLLTFSLVALRAESNGASKPKDVSNPSPNKIEPFKGDFVEQQLLVAFDSDKSAEGRNLIFKKHDVKEIEKVGSTSLYLVESKKGVDLKKLQLEISKEKGVRYVEHNVRMKTFNEH